MLWNCCQLPESQHQPHVTIRSVSWTTDHLTLPYFVYHARERLISCYFGRSLSVNIEQNVILLCPLETIMINNGGYFHSWVIISVSAHIRNANTWQLRNDSVSMCYLDKNKYFFSKKRSHLHQSVCQAPTIQQDFLTEQRGLKRCVRS